MHLVRLYDCRNVAERDLGIEAAVSAVKSGDLVVLPTDTVYGVGADAFKSWSVTALLNAKGRGRQMPPPVLVGSRNTLDGLVSRMPSRARDLVEAFWPGALTIVVEQAASLQWDLGETNGTVAVRMPLHPVALEILRQTGPMAVSSANLTGEPTANTAEEAREQLGYKVSVYLEAGPAPEPVPSTIVDLTQERPVVLRQGAITFDQLRSIVPDMQAAS
ncbi:L-threonylcarbamoyladenylate synthase [Hamadaea sp.]|uniref:L-threonylcarbamoyladenylate synthase n=1 Tax=Hamadaea sp. TaxID=2024425 RepID=UPI0025C5D8A4|nr:L-threonylcarbamoyladenylate synthase [Hamadaea sp.]